MIRAKLRGDVVLKFTPQEFDMDCPMLHPLGTQACLLECPPQ